jgi:hypothetical protein
MLMSRSKNNAAPTLRQGGGSRLLAGSDYAESLFSCTRRPVFIKELSIRRRAAPRGSEVAAS